MKPTILAFETSCDETSVAVVRGLEVLSNIISSQVEIHARFGGVVPEVAARAHVESIRTLTHRALSQAGVHPDDLDGVAATSGPGRNFLLFTIAVFGEEGYLDYWKKLKPNLLTVAAGWSEGYGLYTQGEAPIVLSYDTSPAYHREFEGNDQYDNLIFDDKAYAQVEVAGILKNSRNIENAERLIDFIVSLEFQNRIPLNQIMYPVHPDATLPESFRAVTRAKEFVNLDEERISGSLDKWLRDWEAVMR